MKKWFCKKRNLNLDPMSCTWIFSFFYVVEPSAHANLSATLATDQKWPLSHLLVLPKLCTAPFTIVPIRDWYYNKWVIFDQWPKLHLGLHVQLSKKIFNCIYHLMNDLKWQSSRKKILYFSVPAASCKRSVPWHCAYASLDLLAL